VNWAEFWAGLEHFVTSVGWIVVLALSVPVLLWKLMDMRSKRSK